MNGDTLLERVLIAHQYSLSFISKSIDHKREVVRFSYNSVRFCYLSHQDRINIYVIQLTMIGVVHVYYKPMQGLE